MDPSDSLLAPLDFSRPALYARSLPDAGCQVGSLLFRILLSQRATVHYPGEVQQTFWTRSAVCCLRREMSGSALPNTFRLII
jgi:hypothetical protein